MLRWGRCRTPCSSKIRGDCYMRNMKWRTLRRFVHCIFRPIQIFNLKSVFVNRFLRYKLEQRASTRFGWEWSIKHSFILSIYVPAVPRLNPSLYFVTENGGIQKKVHVAYECCDFLCDHANTWIMLNGNECTCAAALRRSSGAARGHNADHPYRKLETIPNSQDSHARIWRNSHSMGVSP